MMMVWFLFSDRSYRFVRISPSVRPVQRQKIALFLNISICLSLGGPCRHPACVCASSDLTVDTRGLLLVIFTGANFVVWPGHIKTSSADLLFPVDRIRGKKYASSFQLASFSALATTHQLYTIVRLSLTLLCRVLAIIF